MEIFWSILLDGVSKRFHKEEKAADNPEMDAITFSQEDAYPGDAGIWIRVRTFQLDLLKRFNSEREAAGGEGHHQHSKRQITNTK